MQDIHNRLQDYFEELLLFYGFNAIKEFEVPSGRIDLAGFRENDGLSIGIEITRTSDALRDASKLTEHPFKLRFIVVDDPLRDKWTLSNTGGIQISVVLYEWFENELRRALKIPPSLDKFIPFYIERRAKQKAFLESEFGLSEFEGFLKTHGLDKFTEEILDALAFIYTVGEVPSRFSVFTKTRGVEYYGSNYIDPKILSILGGYNIIRKYSKGTAESRTYFVGIKNKNLAKQVVLKKIKENEESLNDLIQKYGDKAYIIAKGTKTHEGLKLAVELHQNSKKDLFEIAKDACPLSSSIPLGLKEVPIDLISRYCYFLTYSPLYDSAVKFFQRLKSLAVKIPTYGSYGQDQGDKYRTSEEVADFIQRKAKAKHPYLDEFAVKFGVLAIIAYCSESRDPNFARKKFNELLRNFEIPLEKAEEELNKLNELEMTSKLIQEGETLPFIVLEPDAFKGYVRRELEKLLIT